MKFFYTIILTLTAMSGCAKKNADKPVINMNKPDTTAVASADSLNYLALGDSYTIGESVAQADSYPYQLTTLLNGHSFPVKPPTIIATTGWTTDELISAIGRSTINGKKYDFVTLLIGVNDQYRRLSQDNYRIKFAEVLNTAIGFANGDTTKVFVLSIPDWGVTPFGSGQDSVIGPQIDQFNAINKQISQKAGVNYLDITGISREAANDPELTAGDGLHPSAIMYRKWIALLEPMVEARLKKK